MKEVKLKYPRYYRLGKSYRLTNDEISQMKKWHEKGKSNLWIAKKYDISPAGVRYHVNPEANEYYKKRLREKVKNETREEKNQRQYRDYHRKKEIFGRQFLGFLNWVRKNYPSRKIDYKKYGDKTIDEILTKEEMEILKSYRDTIRPKLRKFKKIRNPFN